MNMKHLIFSSMFAATAMMSAGDMFLCSADGDDDGASGGGSTALTGGGGAGPVDTGHEGTLYGNDDNKPNPADDVSDDDVAKAKAAEDAAKAADDKSEWKEYVNDPEKSDEENEAAKAEHDKTKPKEDDEKGKKKDEPVPVKAEEYEFVDVPEGFELDPAVDKEFREFAAARGWSKEDVKELSGLQVKLYEKQAEAHADRVASWGEELKTDKEIGGRAYDENVAKAREAKLAFFPPEADAILDKTGLGNHPAFVKGFVRIGKAMGEMQTLPGKGKAANTSILENLYGSE